MSAGDVTYRGEVRFDPEGGRWRRYAWRVIRYETDEEGVMHGRLAFGVFSSLEGRTTTREAAVRRAAAEAAVLNDDERGAGEAHRHPWDGVR